MNSGIGDEDYFRAHYVSRDWRRYRWLASEVVRFAEPGPVLDLGAGMGFLVEAMGRWGLKCTGVEGAEWAVAAARERVPGMDMRCASLSEKLPFPDGSFTAVLMNQVIEHLEAAVAASCVREAYRVLAPGGMLYITSPSRYNSAERAADPTHINMYSPRELRSLLRDAGFGGLIENNGPRPLLGGGRLGLRLAGVLLNLTGMDCLSATANCIAFKPGETLPGERGGHAG